MQDIRVRRAGVACTSTRRVAGEGAFVALRVAGVATPTWRRRWRFGDALSCSARASYRGRGPRSRRRTRREGTHNDNWVSGTARLGGVFVTLLSLGCGFALGSGCGGTTIFNSATVSAGTTSAVSALVAAVLMAIGIA